MIEADSVSCLEKFLNTEVCLFFLASLADDFSVHQVHANAYPFRNLKSASSPTFGMFDRTSATNRRFNAAEPFSESHDAPLPRFRASAVRCGQLLQRQGNILVDIANYKISSHSALLNLQSLISSLQAAIKISPVTRTFGIGTYVKC